MTALTILGMGFLLGVRHATDADHVVAVTTIVSRERTARGAAAVGALWGLGHMATILVVGGAIVAFGLVVPPRLALGLEMIVALMLVALGAVNLRGGAKRPVGADPAAPRSSRLRPVVVGVVHGLAGSAAVALLVLATIRRADLAVLYLAIFGAGTILGMVVLSLAMVMPLAAAAARLGAIGPALARLTGAFSIAFGIFLAYQIGMVDGLVLPQVTWTPPH